MEQEQLRKRRIHEGWGSDNNFNNYSPVQEAEQITRDAAAGYAESKNQGEQLWEYTLASFQTILEQKSAEGSKPDENGHHFSVFDTANDAYPDLQIAFDWVNPGSRGPSDEGKILFGSLFFSRDTGHGRDVLAYSLCGGPNGLDIERQVLSYDRPFDIGLLSSEYGLGNSDYLQSISRTNPLSNPPGITNAEIFSAIDFANEMTTHSSQEQGSSDQGPAGLSYGDSSIASSSGYGFDGASSESGPAS